jgi:2-keto-3-deoxy-L-fuconate dehydrogenase
MSSAYSRPMKFSGKTIVITGAASGIGRATAEYLAKNGASKLLLVDVDSTALQKLQLSCAFESLVGDVSDERFWDATQLGEIDHAVVNAGIVRIGPIVEFSFEDWRRVLSVNLDGAFLTIRAVLRAIRSGGSIVVTASAGGIKAEPGTAAYGSSKAAVIHLARIAAREAAARNVRVNSIAPGGVETHIWDENPMFAELAQQIGRGKAFAEMAAAATPLNRFAMPEDIAAQIAFLLSDVSGTMTGSLLVTDGGYSI